MAGRPRFEPSPADRNTVKNMAAAGIPERQIARCVGVAGITEKTLRKHFRQELDTSPQLVTGFAMSKLFAAIQLGEAWAICFWLKSKAGFQEVRGHRFVDGDGKDRALTLADVDAIVRGEAILAD